MELSKSAYGNGRESNNAISVAICVVIILVASWVMVGIHGCIMKESAESEARWRAERAQAHAAWVKLTDRKDITFEEWDLMRRNRVLPNNLNK